MSCDPSTTVTAADITGLKADILTVEEVVESTALTTVTKNGLVIPTLTGRLSELGYLPPIAYAGSIAFLATENTKTVERNGIVYAPKITELPFTTTGTWAADDEDKFYVVQGLTLYGGQVLIPKTSVSAMQSDANLQIGNLVLTEGYYAAGDAGGAFYKIVAAATGTDDGGSFIDLTASGLQAQALFSLTNFSVAQFGAVGNGVADDTGPGQAAVDAITANGGGTLTLPLIAGAIYKWNLVVESDTTIEGASRDIKMIPATNSPVITLRPDVDVSRVSLRNISIDGTANKATFLSQDGVRSAPDTGVKHDTLSLVDCLITECGANGLALIGKETVGDSGRVETVDLTRTVITNTRKSGLHIVGNVSQVEVLAGAIENNGDETIDTQSNVAIEKIGVSGSGIPESIDLTSVSLDTTSYVAGGNTIAILGAVDVTIARCSFAELHTGVLIKDAPNGNIVLKDNRFERSSGAITALVDLQDVNGFIYDNNNVAASTTGPVGIELTGDATDLVNLDIKPNCSWGGLTAAMDNFPPAFVTAGDADLPKRQGLIQLNLSADGTADLDNLYDNNGGITQLLDGDMVTLHTTTLARKVTVKHGTGNIKLDAGADYLLDASTYTITLRWHLLSGNWVEVGRSSNS